MKTAYLAAGCLVLMTGGIAVADETHVYYVVTSNPSPQAPYTNLAWAATNIQTAVNQAQADLGPGTNCIVLVSDGTYNLGASLTISKGITVRSVNGAGKTTMRANPSTFSVVRLTTPGTNAVLDGFTITGGGGAIYGGAINISATNGMVMNCILGGNAAERGGALYIGLGGTVANCIITNNNASHTGGGVRVANGNARFVNCLFAGNEAGAGGGGGLFLTTGSNLLENCTITANKTAGVFSGGGVSAYDSKTVVLNCIVYANLGSAPNGNNYIRNAGTLALTNCCTLPLPLVGAIGTNNISSNPLFVDAGGGYGQGYTNGNYQLLKSSPCVEAGTNQPWMATARDLSGKPRIGQLRVDMGAYEWAGSGTVIFLM